jgi:uncharacterized spore protein YtfJ
MRETPIEIYTNLVNRVHPKLGFGFGFGKTVNPIAWLVRHNNRKKLMNLDEEEMRWLEGDK